MDLIAILAHEPLTSPGLLAGEPTKGDLLKTIAYMRPQRILLLTRQERLGAVEAVRRLLPPEADLAIILLENLVCENLSRLVVALKEHSATLDRYRHASILNSGYPQERAALWLLKNEGLLEGPMIEPPQDYTLPPSPAILPERPLRVAEPTSSFDNEIDEPSINPQLACVAGRIGCIGNSPRWRRTLEEVAVLATHPTPILLLGETGSGKEILARLAHALSSRANMPIVSVNCAALPEALAESILFGHEKGSFTGAYKRQKGKFEQADGGTLFLDELGELSLANQAKLLRVLETRSVDILGGSEPVAVNVRVIAATNRNLLQEVAQGRFREDLYYRLRAGEVEIPALRERASDIPIISLHLLDRFNSTILTPKQFSKASLKFLEAQPWPGNVRDLMNTIERAALMSPRTVIEPEDFKVPSHVRKNDHGQAIPSPYPGFSLEEYLHKTRRALFEKALEMAGGNRSEAARLLGVSPQAVHKYHKQERPQAVPTP
jgi:DNA-binding NtrC family response regulator